MNLEYVRVALNFKHSGISYEKGDMLFINKEIDGKTYILDKYNRRYLSTIPSGFFTVYFESNK